MSHPLVMYYVANAVMTEAHRQASQERDGRKLLKLRRKARRFGPVADPLVERPLHTNVRSTADERVPTLV
ncbi:MAG: hypothetical protein OEX04_05745 [Acidimicrobiia bacterium]|nr:hypothetical protein [Acidimicrobiia bacterium]MDH4306962.1 hypothetical protein [Acidimicrobiia bacterium]MDH5292829.1 hypothetical protein [Acidimicrobiia bacterium]